MNQSNKPKSIASQLRKERIRNARRAEYMRFLATRKASTYVDPWKVSKPSKVEGN